MSATSNFSEFFFFNLALLLVPLKNPNLVVVFFGHLTFIDLNF